MSEWTKEQTIEAVSRLIELTQTEKIVWSRGSGNPPRVGYSYTPPYYGKYKDRLWRIQGEVLEKSWAARMATSSFGGGSDRLRRVVLELVDEDDKTLYELPNVPNLGSLMKEVQRQSTKPEEVLQELLG